MRTADIFVVPWLARDAAEAQLTVALLAKSARLTLLGPRGEVVEPMPAGAALQPVLRALHLPR